MTIREEAEQLLAAQEAKGIAKYGATLDDAGLDALALISHDVEERADSLHYALAARRAVSALIQNNQAYREQIARLHMRVADLEDERNKARAEADDLLIDKQCAFTLAATVRWMAASFPQPNARECGAVEETLKLLSRRSNLPFIPLEWKSKP